MDAPVPGEQAVLEALAALQERVRSLEQARAAAIEDRCAAERALEAASAEAAAQEEAREARAAEAARAAKIEVGRVASVSDGTAGAEAVGGDASTFRRSNSRERGSSRQGRTRRRQGRGPPRGARRRARSNGHARASSREARLTCLAARAARLRQATLAKETARQVTCRAAPDRAPLARLHPRLARDAAAQMPSPQTRRLPRREHSSPTHLIVCAGACRCAFARGHPRKCRRYQQSLREYSAATGAPTSTPSQALTTTKRRRLPRARFRSNASRDRPCCSSW